MNITEATIEADAEVPLIHIRRDFAATPDQLMRAHLDVGQSRVQVRRGIE